MLLCPSCKTKEITCKRKVRTREIEATDRNISYSHRILVHYNPIKYKKAGHIRIHLEVDHKRKIDSETNKERHMRRI